MRPTIETCRNARDEKRQYIPRLNTTRSGSTGIASSHSGSNRGERAGEDGTRCRGERTSNGLAEHYELNVKRDKNV
jgi:hypothetical protein